MNPFKIFKFPENTEEWRCIATGVVIGFIVAIVVVVAF